jgi:hypothetical protein
MLLADSLVPKGFAGALTRIGAAFMSATAMQLEEPHTSPPSEALNVLLRVSDGF